MLKDFEIIEHCFNDNIKIVPLFDAHIGSSAFMEKEFKETIKYIQSNDNVYAVIGGDLIDNACLVGKNLGIFDNQLSPMQQIEKAIEYIRPIKDKILGVVSGNHEARSEKVTGLNPMTLICTELGLQNVYRNNLAIIKIKLGKREDDNRATYVLLVHHGVGTDKSSLNKDKEFINSFEGADIICTGHTHNGKCGQHMKYVVDTHNNKTHQKLITEIVANSFMSDADYALKNMMVGAPHSLISFDLPKKKNKKVTIHID